MNIFKLLKTHKKDLTKQQYKTLVGQAAAGDETGALKGLSKLLKRNSNEVSKTTTH